MFDDVVWQAIVSGLPSYLERQRWYADKLRPIRTVGTLDLARVPSEQGELLLGLISIDYEIGDSRRYFVPIALQREPGPESSLIAFVDHPDGAVWIQDAVSDAAFREFLIEAGRGMRLHGSHGTYVFEPWTLDGTPYALDPNVVSETTAFEQSNSSIVYGHEVIAKIYRRLEVGQNIEVDMNRYLASEARFPWVPKLIGAATYRNSDGAIPLALVQQHVGDHRDCWTALTDVLRRGADGSLEFAEGLGRVTGEMHVALAAAPEGSILRPEPITANDIAFWRTGFLKSAEETDWITGERLDRLPDRSRQAAREYLDRPRMWDERAHGYTLLDGLHKTRVHGDFHLGQVLVTKDGRLLVVDFEGEPQRPAFEREAKYSPLKDVAGMLRSMSYATGVVASSHDVQADAVSRAWLEDWERDARQRFLAAYRTAIAASPIPIAPEEESAFLEVLRTLETDKAFYEVRYELSSRPDWAWLPLDSIG
ncbi:MAG: phosphotransferase [Thermomicrobiales bacterium]|nr:phosphotransferase [Thermomicrobiales bacterium]